MPFLIGSYARSSQTTFIGEFNYGTLLQRLGLKMRYLFYYYNNGTLILKYEDDYIRKRQKYLFYSLREAIRKFRQDNNLRYKHIKIKNLQEN